MENLEKRAGKGVFMKRQWQELEKAGSPAMSMNEISDFLEGGEKMLDRTEVINIIKRYFERKLQTVINEDGEEITVWKTAPRKNEFAAALGVSANTLARYVAGEYDGREYCEHPTKARVRKSDFDLIRKAYQIITDYYESKLPENRNPAGIIFWLKNANNEVWSDEQNVKIVADSGRGQDPQQVAAEIAARHQIGQAERPEPPELE